MAGNDMGMYDSVMVKCPNCGDIREFQSKSGDCFLEVYTLKNCPDNVMADVNRHSPYKCDCGISFEVDIENRKAVVPGHTTTNDNNWVAYDWNKPETRPPKYGKYFVRRKDGKVHWETWNGSGWAYNNKVITHWMEIKPPLEPQQNSGEMWSFLLVNALRHLNEEQRAGLCFDLYSRSELTENIDDRIRKLKQERQ